MRPKGQSFGCSFLVATLALCACKHESRPTDGAAPIRSSATEASAPKPVLAGVPWQTDLFDEAKSTDAGGEPSGPSIGVVSVPLGATEPRPIMVVLHGAGDRPEWECGSWRGVTNAYPVLVCPRGAGPDRWLGWRSPEDTQARIARAIAAAKRVLPGWVRDDESVVLAGFSMGALQAALVAQKEPTRYRRVVLAESAFNPDSAMKFGAPWASRGGERVVLLCTTRGCEMPYRAAAKNVTRFGASARLNITGTNEHGVFDTVVRSMRRDLPWLVEGVPGWSEYRPPAEEAELPGKTESFESDAGRSHP